MMLLATAILLALAQVEYLRPTEPVPEPTAARVEIVQIEQATATSDDLRVDAAFAATIAVSELLAQNTTIEVRRVPLESARLDRAAISVNEFYEAHPSASEAVVTMRSVLPDAGLFAAARRNHIRTIEIDASTPLGGGGVGIARSEGGALPWLSLSNLSRMLEIVAADFTALAPSQTPAIDANLNAGKQDLFGLRQNIAGFSAELENPFVVTLSPHANTLLQECGFYVAAALPEWHGGTAEYDWAAARELVESNDPVFVVADALIPEDALRLAQRELGICVKRVPSLVALEEGAIGEAWPAFMSELRDAITGLYVLCQP